jgi:hypothetical protein
MRNLQNIVGRPEVENGPCTLFYIRESVQFQAAMKNTRVIYLLVARLRLGAQSTVFYWGASLYPNYSGRRLIVSGIGISEKRSRRSSAWKGQIFLQRRLLAGWQGQKDGLRMGLNFMQSVTKP